MFTGIIETIGEVVATAPVGGDVRVTIQADDFADKQIALGDSVAINGVCLTVIDQYATRFMFDVSMESINHTLIGDWQIGVKVNLELALLPTSRMGGHLVSGHVDGLARLISLEEDARSWRMVFEVPEKLKKYIAKKGSITINGISLTVNSVDDRKFDVNVIPHTFEVTTMSDLSVDDQVHIEVDLIARYLERMLEGQLSADAGQAIAGMIKDK